MITLSTLELRGLLNDVIPFASTSDEEPAINCVRLENDGEKLLALSADRFRIAKCWWTPDEETYDDDVDTEALIALFKIEDDAPHFSVRIGLEDAKNVVKAFALKGKKCQFAPITISVRVSSVQANTYTVSFVRAASPLWLPLSFHVEGRGAPRVGTDDHPEGDLHQLIRAMSDVEGYVPGVFWTPKLLAGWAKCRDHGPLEMAFTGENSAVRWKMGHRFEGLIQPVREPEEEKSADVAFDFNITGAELNPAGGAR